MDEKLLETIQLVLDESNHVTSFATLGGIEGAIKYDGPIPDGFLSDPYPTRYFLKDSVLVVDTNFTPPAIDEEAGPNLLDQINQVNQNLAKASYQLMATQQQNEALAKQNATMGFEIMQLKQTIAAQETTQTTTNGGNN